LRVSDEGGFFRFEEGEGFTFLVCIGGDARLCTPPYQRN
jgi:hypothetical protein